MKITVTHTKTYIVLYIQSIKVSFDYVPSHQSLLSPNRKFGIEVKDFGPSWRDGFAFNAMVHNMRPDLVDMNRLTENPNRVNLENAFSKAEEHLGIPRLLDAEGEQAAGDVMCVSAERRYQFCC